VNKREYLGSVSVIKLSSTHAAVLIEDKVLVHPIEVCVCVCARVCVFGVCACACLFECVCCVCVCVCVCVYVCVHVWDHFCHTRGTLVSPMFWNKIGTVVSRWEACELNTFLFIIYSLFGASARIFYLAVDRDKSENYCT